MPARPLHNLGANGGYESRQWGRPQPDVIALSAPELPTKTPTLALYPSIPWQLGDGWRRLVGARWELGERAVSRRQYCAGQGGVGKTPTMPVVSLAPGAFQASLFRDIRASSTSDLFQPPGAPAPTGLDLDGQLHHAPSAGVVGATGIMPTQPATACGRDADLACDRSCIRPCTSASASAFLAGLSLSAGAALHAHARRHTHTRRRRIESWNPPFPLINPQFCGYPSPLCRSMARPNRKIKGTPRRTIVRMSLGDTVRPDRDGHGLGSDGLAGSGGRAWRGYIACAEPPTIVSRALLLLTTTPLESSRFHIRKPPQLHPIPPALALRDNVNVSPHLYESHHPPVQLWHPLKAPQASREQSISHPLSPAS